MGRKERCPQCGSKKIRIRAGQKECGVCKNTWRGKPRGKASRKDRVRF